jgi:phosphate transport system permease protein
VISLQKPIIIIIFTVAEAVTVAFWALALLNPTLSTIILFIEVLLESMILKRLTATIAAAPIVVIGVTGVALIVWSYPSIVVNGIGFLSTSTWNPHLDGEIIQVNGISTLSGASYGALIFIVGTLLSSGIALLFAVPMGLGIALFLTQVAPRKIAAPISFLVEMLAGIPSVVYGFWGFLVLAPFLLQVVKPLMADRLSFIPFLAGPSDNSSGLLATGIILALMAVPIIASTSRDAMSQAPKSLKEGARALGLTNWEITREIVIPSARTGIIGSIVLGLGRAFGESIAVAMVSGIGVELFPKTLFYPINTIAAFLVLSLSSAPTDPSGMNTAALMELALLLLAITVTVNVIARLLVRRGFGTSETIIRV